MSLRILCQELFEGAMWNVWFALKDALDYGAYAGDLAYPWYGHSPAFKNPALWVQQ